MRGVYIQTPLFGFPNRHPVRTQLLSTFAAHSDKRLFSPQRVSFSFKYVGRGRGLYLIVGKLRPGQAGNMGKCLTGGET